MNETLTAALVADWCGHQTTPPGLKRDLVRCARVAFVRGRIELGEFERRVDWLLRHPGEWPPLAWVLADQELRTKGTR